MAWAFVTGQSVVAVVSAAGHTVTSSALSGSTVVSNRLIVGTVVWNEGTRAISTVTDSKSNSWTKHIAQNLTDGGYLGEGAIWSAPITVGGSSHTITVTGDQQGATWRSAALIGREYSGLSVVSGSGALDGSLSSSGSGGTASAGTSGATTAANELAVGFFGDDGYAIALASGDQGAGWTFGAANGSSGWSDMLFEERDTGSSGSTVTPNLATGKPGDSGLPPWVMLGAVFKLLPVLIPVRRDRSLSQWRGY